MCNISRYITLDSSQNAISILLSIAKYHFLRMIDYVITIFLIIYLKYLTNFSFCFNSKVNIDILSRFVNITKHIHPVLYVMMLTN